MPYIPWVHCNSLLKYNLPWYTNFSVDSAKTIAIILPHPLSCLRHLSSPIGQSYLVSTKICFSLSSNSLPDFSPGSSFDGEFLGCITCGHHSYGLSCDASGNCVQLSWLLGPWQLALVHCSRKAPRPGGGWLSHQLRSYGNVVFMPTWVHGQIETCWIWLLGFKKQKSGVRGDWTEKGSLL